MKRENTGLFYYIKPGFLTYADEANKLASDVGKRMNEALIKSGFRKSMEEIGMNFKEQVRKEYAELTEKIGKLDDFVTKILAGEIKEETVEKFELLER